MNNIMGAFTGFEGRLNRQRWWIGVIILAIIGIIISWILGAIFGTGLIMNPADATDPAALIFAYPYLAIAIKRRHDRNNNGYDVIGFLILELLINLLNALGLALGMLSGLLGIILLVYAIYLLVVLGFLKGTAGPNNYGPDPLQG
jgi:uncharacterized membrane protein YhaH (DUF805 family)